MDAGGLFGEKLAPQRLSLFAVGRDEFEDLLLVVRSARLLEVLQTPASPTATGRGGRGRGRSPSAGSRQGLPPCDRRLRAGAEPRSRLDASGAGPLPVANDRSRLGRAWRAVPRPEPRAPRPRDRPHCVDGCPLPRTRSTVRRPPASSPRPDPGAASSPGGRSRSRMPTSTAASTSFDRFPARACTDPIGLGPHAGRTHVATRERFVQVAGECEPRLDESTRVVEPLLPGRDLREVRIWEAELLLADDRVLGELAFQVGTNLCETASGDVQLRQAHRLFAWALASAGFLDQVERIVPTSESEEAVRGVHSKLGQLMALAESGQRLLCFAGARERVFPPCSGERVREQVPVRAHLLEGVTVVPRHPQGIVDRDGGRRRRRPSCTARCRG